MQNKKLLYISTYGCQMNVYDSARMKDLLNPHGFESTEDFKNADVVILNTCHIREKAAEKIYSELGKIRLAKEEKAKNGQHMVIVVAGCVAQAEGNEIFSRAPFVDIVVGSQAYYNLPTLIEKVKREKSWAIDLDFPEDSKFDKLPDIPAAESASAFLSIQEGCDKFCHFCVVPYTRGAEYSRPISAVYREALKLVHTGAKEISLLGQNVSAYHGHDDDGKAWGLGKLIRHIAKIPNLERIRYMTSHPRDMIEDDLFEAHANEPKFMPFLHLPVQSGSDKILEAMNRKHNRDFYFKTIDKFRQARSDMAFSSDFIVGYPGETDKDFQDTIDLVKRVGFAQCYSFKYSPRPGTPASVIANQVPENVKAERLAELQELIYKQQTEFNSKFLGKTLNVLLEKPGRHEGQIQGKSEYLQAVIIKAPGEYINKILPVKITSIESNSLLGETLSANLLGSEAA